MAHSKKPLILITNDDGIKAKGLRSLTKSIQSFSKTIISAPDGQRSSIGHAITLAHPIWSYKVTEKNNLYGHAVSGTPADCIKYAYDVLKVRPQMVLSGINHGDNDGCSVFYSGTIAGAREGALLGIPSISFSLASFTTQDFKFAAKYAAKIVKYFLKHPIPNGTFLNVNIPNITEKQLKGILFTKQGTQSIHGKFIKRTDPQLREYYWMSGKFPPKQKNNTVDTNALHQKYITVTPILIDTTNHEFLDEQQSLEIKC